VVPLVDPGGAPEPDLVVPLGLEPGLLVLLEFLDLVTNSLPGTL